MVISAKAEKRTCGIGTRLSLPYLAWLADYRVMVFLISAQRETFGGAGRGS